MARNYSAWIVVVATGWLGLGIGTGAALFAKDDLDPPATQPQYFAPTTVPPPVQPAQGQVGRYRVSVIQETRQLVLLDTATGQTWLRSSNGNWADASQPDLKKTAATPTHREYRVVPESRVVRGADGIERTEVVPRMVPVETRQHLLSQLGAAPTVTPAPTLATTVLAPVTTVQQGPSPTAPSVQPVVSNDTLILEVTEALEEARTPHAKARLGADLREAVKKAKAWKDLQPVPPQYSRPPQIDAE